MYCNKLINYLSFCGTFGLKNFVYFVRLKKQGAPKLPSTLPVFGRITLAEEILNIRDNIYQGSIRDRRLENEIRRAKKPVIVDCGVNVGITVRWWFHLNPLSSVYGVDMMQEAQDFTMKSLPDSLRARYTPITAALASESGKNLEIRFNDPLFGGNSVMARETYTQKRLVPSLTLDDCLEKQNIPEITLLKIDIEGAAAMMLRGGTQSLKKVKNILFEFHDDDERKGSIDILSANGFWTRKEYKRHIWLERP